MKIQVSLLDEKNGTVLFDGLADLEILPSGGRIVSMKTDDGTMVWKILKKGLIIENAQELQTILHLNEKGTGSVRIFTPYGEMESALEQVALHKTEQSLQAAYSMPQAGSFSFCLSGDRLFENPSQETE